VENLLAGLRDDLAYEYQAVIQYTHYAATVTGPYRPQRQGLFRGEIPDELGHAEFLANKIATLGGDALVAPPPVPPADGPREMLEAENGAIDRYVRRISDAEEFGEIGLRVQLETMVQDETGHRDEVRKILEGWPA
jgi:bacterioferritin